MKGQKLIIVLAIVVGVFLFVQQTSDNGEPEFLTPGDMRITTSAFENKGPIPSKYTCDAENISPELSFSEIPEHTQSLVLINHDPDAPRPGGWTHWVIINMEPTIGGILENSKPSSGLETATNFAQPGYGGPCPPDGEHRYFFYLYALDTKLSLDETATKENVEEAMKAHIIETAQLMGTYQRINQ